MFKYDKKIDIENWERITAKSKKCGGFIFGDSFPTSYKVTEQSIKKAEEKIPEYDNAWEKYKEKFYTGMHKIFKKEFPKDVSFYINTSPFSYFNTEKKYISISMSCKFVIPHVLHEANHYMFKKYYQDKLKETQSHDDVKEIFSVVNNDVFKPMNDPYWAKYEEKRSRVLKKWTKTQDIDQVIEYINNNYKDRN